jgi:hypothetical protein
MDPSGRDIAGVHNSFSIARKPCPSCPIEVVVAVTVTTIALDDSDFKMSRVTLPEMGSPA